MGTQFFWFYDILIVSIFVGITFKCFRRGFVSSIVGLITVFVAFLGAMLLSGVCADFVYEQWLRENIVETIDSNMDAALSDNVFMVFQDVDYDAMVIDGVPVNAMELEPDPAGKVTVNLTNVDLRQTGIQNIHLEYFDLDAASLDFSAMNLGKVNISVTELQNEEMDVLLFSKVFASIMQQESELYGTMLDVADAVTEEMAKVSSVFDVRGIDAVSSVIRALIRSSSSDTILAIEEQLVRPVVMISVRSLIFLLIFVIIMIILTVISHSLRVINKIPVVGVINSFFGGIIGILEAALVILMICLFLHFLISITGNTIVFMNTMTIERTYIFKYIYQLEILNFIS